MKLHLTILVAALAAGSAQASDPFIAHEWGTFTSVATEDGNPVQWAPLSGVPDLPCFVAHLGGQFSKYVPGLVRMETPVLYFYAPQAMTLSVHVQFPQGWMSEWYPRATKVTPADADHGPDFRNGSLEWDGVKLHPGTNPVFPTGDSPSRYYAARNTDASPLEIAGQSEKMIFYRGVGNFAVSLRPKYASDGKLEIRNAGSQTIPAAILFESHDGKIGYRMIGPIKDVVQVTPPELNGDLNQLRSELVGVLLEFGLYKKEALAMLETWHDSWFEEGARVLEIVPRAQVDQWLPLTIAPAPGETARVFVGRIEILSPRTRQTIENAVNHRDRETLAKFGRFLGPFLDQMESSYRASALNLVSSIHPPANPAACVP